MKRIGTQVSRTAAYAAVALSIAPTSSVALSSDQLSELALLVHDVGGLAGVVAAWRRAVDVGGALGAARATSMSVQLEAVDTVEGVGASPLMTATAPPLAPTLVKGLGSGWGQSGGNSGGGILSAIAGRRRKLAPAACSPNARMTLATAGASFSWEEHAAYLFSQRSVRVEWDELITTLAEFVVPVVAEDVRLLISRTIHKQSDILRRAAEQ